MLNVDMKALLPFASSCGRFIKLKEIGKMSEG